MSSSSTSSSTTMRWNSPSTKDFSSALGSSMSTYGTSGSTPTPVHSTSTGTHTSRPASGQRRDGLSAPPPTPSQSCTSLLLHDDSRRSSLDSQSTLTSDSDETDVSETEDIVGHLQSQYGLGSFGSGMSVPTPVVTRSSPQHKRRKSQKDKAFVHSEPVSKVGSLLSRYGFGGSSILSRDSR